MDCALKVTQDKDGTIFTSNQIEKREEFTATAQNRGGTDGRTPVSKSKRDSVVHSATTHHTVYALKEVRLSTTGAK